MTTLGVSIFQVDLIKLMNLIWLVRNQPETHEIDLIINACFLTLFRFRSWSWSFSDYVRVNPLLSDCGPKDTPLVEQLS